MHLGLGQGARAVAFDTSDLQVIHLWPNGPSRSLPGVGPESSYKSQGGNAAGTTMLRNVSDPTLTVFRPPVGKGNGVGVIICPGGGWRILAGQHEGVDVANWLVERGYTAFLLKYRVMATPTDDGHFFGQVAKMARNGAAPIPAAAAPRVLADLINDDATRYAREIAAEDGHRALEIVRDQASSWGVNPARIGMMGFSAGAFLTMDVAMEPKGGPLAFVAPIYGGETGGRAIPANAPPMFTAVAQDDRRFFKMVEKLYADWSNADLASELHIFSKGDHGFGMVKQGLPADRWIDLLGDWLADLGLARP
jgi:dienelactone hydrolase